MDSMPVISVIAGALLGGIVALVSYLVVSVFIEKNDVRAVEEDDEFDDGFIPGCSYCAGAEVELNNGKLVTCRCKAPEEKPASVEHGRFLRIIRSLVSR